MFEFLRSLWNEPAPAAERTGATVLGQCPRCSVELLAGHGALHEHVCGRCQGRFLPADVTERLVISELGIEREVLLELVGHFAGERLLCPGCGQRSHPITLRGVCLDFCVGCGGLWCDAGELRRLSSERYEEIQATPAAADDAHPTLPAGKPLTRGAYCVFHQDSTPPPEAAVVDAFQRVARLSRVDAAVALRDFCGVIAEGLAEREARELVAALRGRGVAAAIVDDSWLRLPAPRKIERLVADDEGAKAPDQYGRMTTIPWSDVRAVAAGSVEMKGAFRQRLEEKRTRAGRGLLRYEKVELEVSYAFEEGCALTLDLLVGPGLRRHRLEVTDASRGGWNSTGLETGFISLVHAVVGRARYAALNEGAARLAQGLPPPVLRYRTPRRFEREVSWLLWRYLGPGASR